MRRYLIQRAWWYRRTGKFEDDEVVKTLRKAKNIVERKLHQAVKGQYGHPVYRIVKLQEVQR